MARRWRVGWEQQARYPEGCRPERKHLATTVLSRRPEAGEDGAKAKNRPEAAISLQRGAQM